jgi:hypothetical protein
VALIAVKPVEISTDRGRQREYWVSDMQPHHVLEEMHNISMKIVLSAERTPSTIEGLSIARPIFRTQLCISSAITIEESMSCRMSRARWHGVRKQKKMRSPPSTIKYLALFLPAGALVDGVEKAHDRASKCSSVEGQTATDTMVSSDSAGADVSKEGTLLLGWLSRPCEVMDIEDEAGTVTLGDN